jgi:hypothetical protein
LPPESVVTVALETALEVGALSVRWSVTVTLTPFSLSPMFPPTSGENCVIVTLGTGRTVAVGAVESEPVLKSLGSYAVTWHISVCPTSVETTV